MRQLIEIITALIGLASVIINLVVATLGLTRKKSPTTDNDSQPGSTTVVYTISIHL